MSTAEPLAHGIIFSGPLIRALRAGQKTVTRRIVKEPRWAEPGTLEVDGDTLVAVSKKTGCLATVACPYGAKDDRLWVRETFAAYSIAPRTGVETHWRRMTPAQRRTWAFCGARYHATPEAGFASKTRHGFPRSTCPAGSRASRWRSRTSARSACTRSTMTTPRARGSRRGRKTGWCGSTA